MIWHSLVSAHTFQRVSIVLGWVHGCCQCVNVWEKHFEMEARMTMRFRFTKLPDAFKLCHHLFVSNTVFQKMSSLTVFFFFVFFFSPVVGLQTDPGTWMKVLLLRASVQSCSAMRQVTSLCLWQMYQSTLGLRTHHPKPPRSLVYLVKLEVTITQSWLLFWHSGANGAERLRWEILLMFHQQLNVISQCKPAFRTPC